MKWIGKQQSRHGHAVYMIADGYYDLHKYHFASFKPELGMNSATGWWWDWFQV